MRSEFGLKRTALGLLAAAAVVLSVVFLVGGPLAIAASVTPELIPGSEPLPCSEFEGDGQDWTEFRIDAPANGVFGDGTLSVTISNFDGSSFDWSSNIGVDAVYVKDGRSGSYLYRYDPPAEATADTDLTNPGGLEKETTKIKFCYDLEDTTTTTMQETTTTTVAETTTTVAETTTTAAETTTTVGETTTTTVPDEVLPTEVTTTSTDPEVLPFTGVGDANLWILGAALVAAGSVFVIGARKQEEN